MRTPPVITPEADRLVDQLVDLGKECFRLREALQSIAHVTYDPMLPDRGKAMEAIRKIQGIARKALERED